MRSGFYQPFIDKALKLVDEAIPGSCVIINALDIGRSPKALSNEISALFKEHEGLKDRCTVGATHTGVIIKPKGVLKYSFSQNIKTVDPTQNDIARMIKNLRPLAEPAEPTEPQIPSIVLTKIDFSICSACAVLLASEQLSNVHVNGLSKADLLTNFPAISDLPIDIEETMTGLNITKK